MKKTPVPPIAESVPVGKLHPWDRNPRRNEAAVGPVAASIQRFGFAAPILAQRTTGRVVAGHTRLLAALHLGLAEVPVRWLDLSDGECSALALADNRLGEIATWSADLGPLLAELRVEDVDLAGLGWDEPDLAALLSPLPSAPIGDPAAARPPSKADRWGHRDREETVAVVIGDEEFRVSTADAAKLSKRGARMARSGYVLIDSTRAKSEAMVAGVAAHYVRWEVEQAGVHLVTPQRAVPRALRAAGSMRRAYNVYARRTGLPPGVD